jgi:hypothetical protein
MAPRRPLRQVPPARLVVGAVSRASFGRWLLVAGLLQTAAVLAGGCGDNDCADDGSCVTAGYGGAAGGAGAGGNAGSVDPGLAGTGGTSPISTGSGIFCSPGAANQCAPGTTCCASNGQCSEIGQACPL